MQHLHQKLKTKSKAYHNWHQTKHHNKIHWGVFLAFSFFVSVLFLNPLELNLKKDNSNNNFLSNIAIQKKEARAEVWEPPIGIPDPGFGILDTRPSRPSPWNSEQPGYYYVNFETGTNKPYGTPQNPRQTIPGPIPAGSYVEVHGTYSAGYQGLIWIQGLGNNGPWIANTSGPVWIVGQDTNSKPNFTPYQVIIFGSYIYLDSISTNPGHIKIGSASGLSANHIVIRNCDIAGDGISGGDGLMIIGAQGAEVNHVVAYQNTIHHYGDINSSLDQDAQGIIVDAYSSNIWMLDNTIHTTSGSGVRIGGSYPDPGSDFTHHIYAGRNTVFNTRQAGFGVKYASDTIFSQNHIYDIVDTSWSPSKGLIGQYAPKRMWMLYNTIHGMRYGIYMPSTIGSGGPYEYYAIGNVIYNIHHISGLYAGGAWGEAGIMMYGGTSQYIINNTIYDSDAGINGPGFGKYYIENNIVSKITEQKGNHLYIEHAAQDTTVKNSILHQSTESERIIWGSALYNLNSFQTNTGKGQNSLVADPLFVNPAVGNFQISPASPAKDAGLSENDLTFNVYSYFKTLYGLDIAQDIARLSRPAGNGWDIGAYEVVESDSTAPTITNVTSDHANGSFKTGEVIDIDVTFSEAVTSTGNITITLETGAIDRTCVFTVSNSSSGTCNYTAQDGDASADLTVASISGTIADSSTNTMSNFVPATNLAANKAIVIDTTVPDITPPVRSLGSPTGEQASSATQVTLSLTTNESSTCKYGTSPNTIYSSIANTFTTTGATAHSKTITGLINGASYNYYVRCSDIAGNANTSDYAISFSVAVPTNITAPAPAGGGGGGGGGGFTSDTNPPTAPDSLKIIGTTNQIILRWLNSKDSDFVRTKVVRKENSAPLSVSDGTIIYEGTGEEYTDTNLKPNIKYYYSIYSFDHNLNYSKPTISSASLNDFTVKQAETELAKDIKDKEKKTQTSNSPVVARVYDLGIITLKSGSRGEAVKELQRFLNDKLNLGLVIDGALGPKTIDVIKQWQKDNGLIPDGLIGPKTKMIMNANVTVPQIPTNSNLGCTVATRFNPLTGKPCSVTTTYNLGIATLRNGSRGEAVKELQKLLNKILNLGLVEDGKLGPKTIIVIKKWQKDNGLVADGLVGAKTKAAMVEETEAKELQDFEEEE